MTHSFFTIRQPARLVALCGISTLFLLSCAAFSTAQTVPVIPRYTGVNLSGAEFGVTVPGTFGKDYTYPSHSDVDYFLTTGMNTFRLPFHWERLQHQAYAGFDADEQARLDDMVAYITGKGANVILDPHNYGRYYGGVIGQSVPTAAFVEFWTRLAGRYKDNPRVIFGLMNEPHDMPTETWRDAATAAIAAIRATGATGLILVPGNAYSGAWSWTQDFYGTPNATAMLSITDPANNMAFEVHQYMDGDSSGTAATCVSSTIGAERLQDFTDWLKHNGKRGFLGEFAGGRNQTCYAALDNMLRHIEANTDVWLGWTYWSAGPWWDDYIFSLQPLGNVERPQLTVLKQHIGAAGMFARNPAIPTESPAITFAPTVGGGSSALPAQFSISSQWASGYNVALSLSNASDAPIIGWTVSWKLANGETLANYWNADCAIADMTLTCRSKSYNATIGAKGSTSFGIQFNTHDGLVTLPQTINTHVGDGQGASVVGNGQIAARYSVNSRWNAGYVVGLTLTNTGSTPVTGWTASWQMANGETLANYWNADCSIVGATLTCHNKDYNAILAPNGGSATFGIQFISSAGAVTAPSVIETR